MSPRVKVTREDWISATLQLLAQGQVPASLSLSEQCARLGVTKGSFYSRGHFPGGDADLYGAVIARWLEQNALGALAETMSAVRDPLDRLRLLRARAHDRAGLDGTMRQWAQSDAGVIAAVPEAATAVAEADGAVTAHVGQALGDLGYQPDELSVLGPLVTSAVAEGRLEPGAFDVLLAVLVRAAPQRNHVEVIDVGGGPGRKILFALMENLGPEDLEAVRARALEFQAQHQEGTPARSAARRPAPREQTSGA
jgi:AcrR family transcriptional regulator